MSTFCPLCRKELTPLGTTMRDDYYCRRCKITMSITLFGVPK